MPHWPACSSGRHGKFSIAIVIVATLWLPFLSIASFQEKGEAVGDSISSFGTFMGFFLSALGSTLDSAVDSAQQAARSTYHASQSAYDAISSNAKIKISKLQIKTQNLTSSFAAQANRQHSMVSLSAKALLATAERNLREQISGIHRMLGATIEQIKNTASSALNGVFDSFGSIWNGDPGLGIVSSIAKLKFLSRADTAVEPEEGFEPSEPGIPSPGPHQISGSSTSYRDEDKPTRSPLTIIERIVEKTTEIIKESPSVSPQQTIPQDSRVNKLVTDIADLTSRVDERYGISQGGGAYSNSALFNMISQTQRIKTLDDVKITNATIEGYAQSSSLSNYLPLGGAHSPEDLPEPRFH